VTEQCKCSSVQVLILCVTMKIGLYVVNNSWRRSQGGNLPRHRIDATLCPTALLLYACEFVRPIWTMQPPLRPIQKKSNGIRDTAVLAVLTLQPSTCGLYHQHVVHKSAITIHWGSWKARFDPFLTLGRASPLHNNNNSFNYFQQGYHMLAPIIKLALPNFPRFSPQTFFSFKVLSTHY